VPKYRTREAEEIKKCHCACFLDKEGLVAQGLKGVGNMEQSCSAKKSCCFLKAKEMIDSLLNNCGFYSVAVNKEAHGGGIDIGPRGHVDQPIPPYFKAILHFEPFFLVRFANFFEWHIVDNMLNI
jgi:hypothetical protein